MANEDEFEESLKGFKDTRTSSKKKTQTKFTSSLNVIVLKDKIGNKKKIKKENFKKF